MDEIFKKRVYKLAEHIYETEVRGPEMPEWAEVSYMLAKPIIDDAADRLQWKFTAESGVDFSGFCDDVSLEASPLTLEDVKRAADEMRKRSGILKSNKKG